MIHAFVKKGCFQDSVSLMLISRKLSDTPEVDEVSVMMGTPANKLLIAATGFWAPIFDTATANDICVAIKSESQNNLITVKIGTELDAALNNLSESQGTSKNRLQKARRWQSALDKLPDANVVLISIAGEYAAELSNLALDNHKNVMIFSDNVTLEDEIKLKQKARANGLIVMGPDCGTSMIAGTPLAFANVLPHGNIGIIGASGTGIQELASQIALLDHGITHALGLGGRDLTAEVGGISALSALNMLANDPETQVITFVSKPPDAAVRQIILTAMQAIAKPIVALFLGSYSKDGDVDKNIYLANTLDQAARIACQLSNIEMHRTDLLAANQLPNIPLSNKISGLYTGGTLAAEMALLLASKLKIKLDPQHDQGVMLNADGHKIIDLGDDFYTMGKPHPMIDPTTRTQQILALASQQQIGVLLVDLVIGYGAEADPASSLAAAVIDLRRARPDYPIAVIATITGTVQDPQNRDLQQNILKHAGIIIAHNLPEAAHLAVSLINLRDPPLNLPQKSDLLKGVKVINAGLRRFADDLHASGSTVVHYQWAPIAGGNLVLQNLLKKLV